LDLKTGLDFYPGPFFLYFTTMRAVVFATLVLTLSVHLSANTGISTSPPPAWLYDTHPDLSRSPLKGDIGNGYYYELIDLQSNLLRNTEYTHYII
jgi:hypothetical protein